MFYSGVLSVYWSWFWHDELWWGGLQTAPTFDYDVFSRKEIG
jgi:hypothetical protein